MSQFRCVRRITGSLLALILSAIVLSGTAQARVSDNVELTHVQLALEAANNVYVAALVAADPVRYGELFTADAISLPSHGPAIRGRDAIVSSMRIAFSRVSFVKGSMRASDVSVDGDSATEIGKYDFSVRVDGRPLTLSGRYLTVWMRRGNDWKIFIDSSQPDVVDTPPALVVP